MEPFRGLGDEFLGSPRWKKLPKAGDYKLEDRSARWIEVIYDSSRGHSAQQAQDEITAICHTTEGQLPRHEPGDAISSYGHCGKHRSTMRVLCCPHSRS